MRPVPTLELDTIRRLYDRDYYLTDCDGFREFERSGGARLPRRLAKAVTLLNPRPGERVLDLGCGRGELASAVAGRGARVVAIDPSVAACRIAKPVAAGRLPVLCARGEALPLGSAVFDAVVATDVVEHLPPDDLERMIAECHRVLRPGGRLVIHTQPNRILMNWTLPALSRVSRTWGVTLGRFRDELTPGSDHPYHVNEQSRRSLGRVLKRGGFTIDELWLEGSYPLHRAFGETRGKRVILKWFRRSRWLKELLASQIWAVGRRGSDR